MDTLSVVINKLQKEGYTYSIRNEEINKLNADYWIIDNIYRFEGNSNPSDNSILYALTNIKSNEKALLVNAYGVYADSNLNDFIRKLMMRRDLTDQRL